MEIDTLKWCLKSEEHIPRDGNDLTEEGQILLEDPKLWMDHLTFLWECHTSRKREHTTEDGTFLFHNKGVIPSIFTGDWFLTEGESRDKLGECLKENTESTSRPEENAQVNYALFPVELLVK